MKNIKLTVADIIITVAVIIAAVTVFCFNASNSDKPGVYLAVTQSDNGRTVTDYYPLDTDAEIKLENNGYLLTVIIKDGTAFIGESNCKNQICVASKPISRVGQTVVCAPGRVVLNVLTQKPTGGDADAYAG